MKRRPSFDIYAAADVRVSCLRSRRVRSRPDSTRVSSELDVFTSSQSSFVPIQYLIRDVPFRQGGGPRRASRHEGTHRRKALALRPAPCGQRIQLRFARGDDNDIQNCRTALACHPTNSSDTRPMLSKKRYYASLEFHAAVVDEADIWRWRRPACAPE